MGPKEEVIHLDTNFLIGALSWLAPVDAMLRNWLQQGETFAASSIAWAEFLNGPVNPQQRLRMDNLIQGRAITFGRMEAEMASKLFNQTGRRRGSQPDCFIAATALCAGVPLATRNTKDFQPFVALGLRLA